MEDNNIKNDIKNMLIQKNGIEIYVYLKMSVDDIEKYEIRKIKK